MAVANALRYVHKVVVGVEVGALDVAVTPFARSQHGDGPTILHQSGRKAKSYIVHHVVAHAIPGCAASLGIGRAGGDVDRSSH